MMLWASDVLFQGFRVRPWGLREVFRLQRRRKMKWKTDYTGLQGREAGRTTDINSS